MADFETVRKAELKEIRELRERRGNVDWDNGQDLSGLCFSGGGIRSATFCLGVLQGLATYRMLKRFDYISSVSGGGYIASWLISWIKRPGKDAKEKPGIDFVEERLRQAPPHFNEMESTDTEPHPRMELTPPPPPPPSLLSSLFNWIKGWSRRARESDGMAFTDLNDPLPPLKPAPPRKPCRSEPRYEEPGAINFLRSYSNYLTPRLGLFGADTWVAVATYIRNLLLNQTILLSSLAALLLVPRVVQWIFHSALGQNVVNAWYTGGAALALLVFSLAFVDWNLANFSLREAATEPVEKKPNDENKSEPDEKKKLELDDTFVGHSRQDQVLWFGVLPIFAASVVGTLSLAQFVKSHSHPQDATWYWWIGSGALAYAIGRVIAQLLAWLWMWVRWKWRPKPKLKNPSELQERRNRTRDVLPKFRKRERQAAFTTWIWAPLAGALGGILIKELASLFDSWKGNIAGAAYLVFWGPPILLAIILLTGVLHVGLMSFEKFPNQKKEWWSRLAAWLLIFILVWMLVFAVALFAPLGVLILNNWLKTKRALLASWAGATLYGVLAGKSSKTSGEKGGIRPLELAVSVAPFIFIVGTLVLVSYGIYGAHERFGNDSSGTTSSPEVSAQMKSSGKLELRVSGPLETTVQFSVSQTASDRRPWGPGYWEPWKPGVLAGVFLLLVLIAVLLAYRVDINEYSFHLFYRNRLVRCYLGATNPERCPHPFTGFDPTDDIFLKDFSCKADKKYAGPYPILNAALNITHGQRLAWQERRAESFVFTPKYCGFDFQEERDDRSEENRVFSFLCFICYSLVLGGADSYRETSLYSYPPFGPYLGTAVATSGAAVNPNMGYHASPAAAFLLTLFNVRLGWWMGNPRREDTWQRSTPRTGLFYLLRELFGLADDTSGYINLSDGWHFENLGLYELVRRECTYIVVCDVGADAGFGREDLGNAVRKCRSDFGAEIDLDASSLRPGNDGFSESHFVVGTIRYPNQRKGWILYLKSALTGNEPQDILAYKIANPAFPHQGTGDQWFNESQFESYRALGRFAVESALRQIDHPNEMSKKTMGQIFETLACRI